MDQRKDPRLPAEKAAWPLERLVLVAGARGAGKSTFIRQMVAGTLAPEIARSIPEGTADWPLYVDSKVLEWLPPLTKRKRPPGTPTEVVLHYDLIHLAMFDRKDKVLAALRLARDLTVVTVRPPTDVIVEQYGRRTGKALDDLTRQLATAALSRSRDQEDRLDRAKYSLEYMRQLSDFTKSGYRRPGWIDSLYRAWNAAVTDLAFAETIRRIEVAPRDGPEIGWKLTGASSP